MCFVITKANLYDMSAILRLEQACFSDDAWTILDVIGTLTLPEVIRYKASSGKTLAGFAAAEIHRSEQTGWITTLGVFPQYRKKGIGLALLHECEADIDLPKIRLCVNTKNTEAIHLYLNAGYCEIGNWPAYYSTGCDALVMEKHDKRKKLPPLD
jgi:ribosomal protein S18 acetylase RimI-like enzyme